MEIAKALTKAIWLRLASPPQHSWGRLCLVNKFFFSPLVIALVFGLSPAARAQDQGEAGRIIMAIGSVSVVRDGNSVPAKRNTPVRAGDAVVTGDTSNAQLRLNDGAVIALRPNTEFKVKEFSYSGKADGTEKASLSLVKGGVRAVTGAIGRANRDNLKVDAVVATVGIRGTGFNIKFCDAACKTANPSANEGLYAGVFEGRIDVSNKAGQATELGVNRFAYVQSESVAPQLLIAPPAFLKDSLEAQVRVQPKELSMNSATENNAATLESSGAVEKSPSDSGARTTSASAEKVDTVKVALEEPDVVKFFPKAFFDSVQPVSLNDRLDKPSGDSSRVFAFQSAEFNFAQGRQSVRAANNFIQSSSDFTSAYSDVRALAENTVGATDSNQITEFQYNVAGAANPFYYSIKNNYATSKTFVEEAAANPTLKPGARLIEGGTAAAAGATQPSSGVIAWGRWADGRAFIGNYGVVEFSKDDGIHWIAGERIVSPVATQSWTFSLIGGTMPTEARSGALPGWRLTGGKFDASVSSIGAAISNGILNLYYAREPDGWGNYVMNFAGNPSGSIATTNLAGAVTRINGTANICTGPCGANGTLGFYGNATSGVSHAGMTYQFNTGTTQAPLYVQGAAVFSRNVTP